MNQWNLRTEILKSDEVFATVGLLALLEKEGPDALYWEPETVRISLEATYGDLPEGTLNKINAARQIVTSNSFYVSLSDFVNICNVLSHGIVQDFEADMEEICWAVTEANILFPQEPPQKPQDILSSDVFEYINTALKINGLLIYPSSLKLIGFVSGPVDEALGAFSSDENTFETLYKIAEEKAKFYDLLVKNKVDELQLQLIQANFLKLGQFLP